MKYHLPSGILIDLDDTIIANEVHKDFCWRKVGSEFSSELPEIVRVIDYIKVKSDWFWSDPDRHRLWRQDLWSARRVIANMSLRDLGLGNDGISDRIANRYSELITKELTLFPGALETLSFLMDKGVKLALVTNGNGKSQRSKIERFGLAKYFDYIYIEGEQGIGKPDERAYLTPLRVIGVTARASWMIGDKFEWEVIAPQRLGIKSIWINSRNENNNSSSVRPFLTIGSLSELPGILNGDGV